MSESKRQKIDKHNYEYWLKTKTQGQRKSRARRAALATSSRAMAFLAMQAALGVNL